MSIYLYQHPKTKVIKEVFQSMKENHDYTDSKGVKWNRVFTVPQASFDTHYDPYSSKDFVQNTSNKKGTVGDIWDRSKEAGQKRADKDGVDLKREKYLDDWSKKRGGKLHSERIKENANKTYEIG